MIEGSSSNSSCRDLEHRPASGHHPESRLNRRVPDNHQHADAEYGNYRGGLIDVVTKSGGNHAQFFGNGSVDGNVNSPTFGLVLHVASPRIVQLGAKFTFLTIKYHSYGT
jgi:hypothetical protein